MVNKGAEAKAPLNVNARRCSPSESASQYSNANHAASLLHPHQPRIQRIQRQIRGRLGNPVINIPAAPNERLAINRATSQSVRPSPHA